MKIRKINRKNFKKIALISLAVIIIVGVPATAAVIKYQLAQSTDKIVEDKEPLTEVVYEVKQGDSVFGIASKFKVHRYQIRQWNNIGVNNYLQPGQKLIIKKVDYEPYAGLASWYGPNFHGKNMANGQVYDMYSIVVAHRTLPLGRQVRVTNLDNGKSIIAPVLDRGPYVKNSQGEYTREIDLSYAVASELGTVRKGVVPVRIEPINEPLPEIGL